MISDERLRQLAAQETMREQAEIAKELLAHRKARDGWIKCSERMPEGEEPVMAYWHHTGHVEDVIFAFDEDKSERRYHVLYDGERMNQEPTHWMPLSLPRDK